MIADDGYVFPAATEPSLMPTPSPSATPSATPSPSERPPGRILVADDEAFFAEALAAMLHEEGFDVVSVVSDGARAIEAARALRPDVVLMDMKMPVMDGIEAARRIVSEQPLIQVLMLSAYEDTALREEAAATGVYCYLVKGCRPELLIDMVRKALDRRAVLGRRPAGGG
jgi:response regulator NasT